MDCTKGFRESIGLCNQRKESLGFSSICEESLELSISCDPALIGVLLHLEQVIICGEHRLKGLGGAIIVLNEEQIRQLRDLLNHALCVNAYGRGTSDAAGAT